MRTYDMFQYPRGVNEGGYSIPTSVRQYPALRGSTTAF
jgi:hypothetical protein